LPIYEFDCKSCGFRFQHLLLASEEEKDITCPKCKGKDLKKLVSRVTFHASEQDRLNSYNPKSKKNDTFYKDTRNIGLDAKKRAQQMGVHLGPEFESKLDKLRTDPGKVFDNTE
jgi:putative FmdB family regulatory protein